MKPFASTVSWQFGLNLERVSITLDLQQQSPGLIRTISQKILTLRHWRILGSCVKHSTTSNLSSERIKEQNDQIPILSVSFKGNRIHLIKSLCVSGYSRNSIGTLIPLQFCIYSTAQTDWTVCPLNYNEVEINYNRKIWTFTLGCYFTWSIVFW